MFAQCKSPIWRADDFTTCFEQDYLHGLFPLIVCATSLLYLCKQIYETAGKSRSHKFYKPLDGTVSHAEPNGNGTYDDDTDTDDYDSNEELALAATASHVTRNSIIEVNRPRGELFIVALEGLAVLGELAIHITAFVYHAWRGTSNAAGIAGVAVWTYVAILASLRLLFSSSNRLSFPKLWYHTAFIYGALWLLTVLLFRSAIIHPRSNLSRNLTIADFAIVTLLATIALTTRKENKAVKLEYENGLEPSKEQVASVLSLATFSWVDAIVWKGYTKTYEMEDVWNLLPKDKAAAVLADYRAVKKTNALAWHLLKYFKRGLLIQAAWAVGSGFLTFAPTLLLKVILEYVERPDETPVNAAWFYVILLFVSGCASALADGQALWVGRKVCIRLKAVIIGEIYAKALKRRAASGTDKVLGEANKSSGADSKPSRLKRAFTWGKKKAKDNVKTQDASTAAADAAAADAQVTSGAIINLMAVDSFKVAEICAYLHFLWANTPVQVVLAVYLLYKIMGYSSIAGIGMMALLLPINLFISKRFASIQKKILAATDSRIHTTNEVLSNIRIIKFFAWEQRFIGMVDDKRDVELKHLRHRYMWWAIAATVWSGAPILITFLSFFVYTVVEKKDLVPSVAFTALSLFQILRIPLDQLADMVAHVQESKVSTDRIEEYLNEPETDKYNQLAKTEFDDEGEPLIGFNEGTFSWGSKETDEACDVFRLLDLDIEFKVGQLNVIAGSTGSGKSSLLMALLGEMTLMRGAVRLPGGRSREEMRQDPKTGLYEGVAYCAQQAWLVNDNIKENIVFASPWNPKRYKDVIAACSLQRDLEILDQGDQTLVGEKGVTLSGGQKQRISLARALYSRARHVILDDVLSAVDSHTAKWIFEKALLGPLMYNRTCILVTHNVALCLPQAELAVVLDNGQIVAQGTPTEVIDSGKLGEDLTASRPASRGPSRVQSTIVPDHPEEDTLGEASLSMLDASHHRGDHPGRRHSSTSQVRAQGSENTFLQSNDKSAKSTKTNLPEETKAVGGVKIRIIALYLRAMGGFWFWSFAVLVFAAQQIASVATNVWVREWATAYLPKEARVMNIENQTPVTHVGGISSMGSCLRSGTCVWNLPFFMTKTDTFSIASDMEVNAGYYLGIYALLGILFMIITLSREAVLFEGSLTASRRIHTRLIESITHAKFRFFDSTPLGQLMNRFSKDIESVDQEIAPVAIGVIHCMGSILTIVVLISIITPGFLIAGAFISVLYFFIGKFYINSSRDLKRLESVQRSPIYQQFGESLSGMTTIRAYGDEARFIRDNLTKINTQTRPFLYLWAANRWLAFRVDVVGAMVSFFSGTFVILSVGKIDAGAAGLALTYAVTFTENVLWFVRLYSSNEQNMNSVERIKEYLDVEQEADMITETKPPVSWPLKGSVEFVNYSTRYRPDFDTVLKKISLKILPGEKVGVVGRTGAGKSSLALALFRALEAEEGKILVDDLDIGLLGLQDLRQNIVMVPQDPTLFSGTIRSNLDPFGVFTDEEIFTALRRVQLIGSTATSTASTTPSSPTVAANESDDSSDESDRLTTRRMSVIATTNPGSITSPFHPDASDVSDATIVIPESPTPDNPIRVKGVKENKNLFLNLNSPVAESGTNLSQGQRQLLCLARALLKNPQVLLMDEATASIDYATDAKIQDTIRELKSTTITIAHRLQTIIDYDKVVVMDKGSIVQCGSPWELISNKEGQFRDMCVAAGEGELEILLKLAKRAHMARKLVDDE
ncbi:P-loop containing nucleoside triphosphate hydrolase protein [Pseudovirgaria hyperparasitica]|uniref:P-loop containing nucleoside triphosphate hydrolase protein n=1 Tax=Pseudovirgaria hyperparasitica TaxID=470096 RepID=A0A6A6W339_9PEZI|nr:P-loop containing nucleoside triphosphate hydrolase protein [Pseudovirgaria hyperparasitica]KAF2756007.1 P-loop containing nucleoside triphosphate hydrolase protein [Pseudovirgaria hyperparasitica]